MAPPATGDDAPPLPDPRPLTGQINQPSSSSPQRVPAQNRAQTSSKNVPRTRSAAAGDLAAVNAAGRSTASSIPPRVTGLAVNNTYPSSSTTHFFVGKNPCQAVVEVPAGSGGVDAITATRQPSSLPLTDPFPFLTEPRPSAACASPRVNDALNVSHHVAVSCPPAASDGYPSSGLTAGDLVASNAVRQPQPPSPTQPAIVLAEPKPSTACDPQYVNDMSSHHGFTASSPAPSVGFPHGGSSHTDHVSVPHEPPNNHPHQAATGSRHCAPAIGHHGLLAWATDTTSGSVQGGWDLTEHPPGTLHGHFHHHAEIATIRSVHEQCSNTVHASRIEPTQHLHSGTHHAHADNMQRAQTKKTCVHDDVSTLGDLQTVPKHQMPVSSPRAMSGTSNRQQNPGHAAHMQPHPLQRLHGPNFPTHHMADHASQMAS